MTFPSDGRGSGGPLRACFWTIMFNAPLTRLINTDPKMAGQKPMTSNPRMIQDQRDGPEEGIQDSQQGCGRQC
ncbi:MAG: hypothetical protein H6R38_393 [Deltaproteobacteria bacterium]|nr:hypothetical protein [Deltaproteobacteria bacterium]